MDKIGKLLAQAEGTDNEHEADAFVTRAQELATTYAVDLELARSRQAARRLRAAEEAFEQRRLRIGERGKRGNRQLVLLYLVVAQSQRRAGQRRDRLDLRPRLRLPRRPRRRRAAVGVAGHPDGGRQPPAVFAPASTAPRAWRP